MVNYQKGNIELLEVAPKVFSVKSIKSGYINYINTELLGEIVKEIGGGRETKDDQIDYGVGIVLSKKIGDFVNKDEELYLFEFSKGIFKPSLLFNSENAERADKHPMARWKIMNIKNNEASH